MLKFKYFYDETVYDVTFSNIAPNIVQVLGELPFNNSGFLLSRDGKNDNWNYEGYTTLYRKIEGGLQFSNDGSVYVEPQKPEPYVPTMEEVKKAKIAELNAAQQEVIHSGFNVALSDGSIEHFTLNVNDQLSLIGLQTMIVSGEEQIPWHTSNQSDHCKYYSNADMTLIVNKAMQYVSYHVTYFRDLRIYINSLDDKELVESAAYGMDITEEYQSDILKDMMVAMEG